MSLAVTTNTTQIKHYTTQPFKYAFIILCEITTLSQEDEHHKLHTEQHIILYLVYLHKGFICVITIIAVQLDYSRSTACAVKITINRISRPLFHDIHTEAISLSFWDVRNVLPTGVNTRAHETVVCNVGGK